MLIRKQMIKTNLLELEGSQVNLYLIQSKFIEFVSG